MESNLWVTQSGINTTGSIQQSNVGRHAHNYIDRGVGEEY
jgi:hypothetical protein